MTDSVVILGPAHPFRGGIAVSNERLAQEFQNLGWETKMFTYTTQYPKLIFPGKNQFSPDPAPSNLNIQRKFSTVNPFSWKKLVRQLHHEKPKLILSRYFLPYTALSTSYIQKQLLGESNMHSVSIVDNLNPHQQMPGDPLIQKYFLSSVNKFFALSESVKSDLDSKLPSHKVSYSPLPLFDHYGELLQKEDACLKLKIDPNYRYMLFFGFIKAYKGLDLLLESIDKEYMIKNRIKLIIAGDIYGDGSVYDNIIRNKDLVECIIFHKRYIPIESVKEYFSVCDLVVQTYITATQSGITQMALHFEKPILVTDVGGLSESVVHNETGYITPKDHNQIMKTIMKHFDSVDLNVMVTKVKKEKTKYQWKPFTEKLIQFALS